MELGIPRPGELESKQAGKERKKGKRKEKEKEKEKGKRERKRSVSADGSFAISFLANIR